MSQENKQQGQTSQMAKRRDQGVKVRLKFKKSGIMKFIGHLDMMRFFQKLIRRAELDIAYSDGFHPHQIMSFANPLGVGLLSNGEYVDITLNSATSSEDIVAKLNEHSVDGVEITDAVRLPQDAGNGMASVARADYTVRFSEGYENIHDFDIESSLESFYNREEIPVTKKTKKGSKVVDLKVSVHKLYVQDDGAIFMSVNAGSSENIRPELVMQAFFEFLDRELPEFSFIITREEQYDQEGRSLLDVGNKF